MRDGNRHSWFPYAVIALLLAILAAGTTSNLIRNPQPRLVANEPTPSTVSSGAYR